jgi:hypothetical protein
MPNTSKNSKTISNTLSSAGMDYSKEFTTVLIPSFFETTLSGLSALNALKPLMKEISADSIDASRTQVRIEKQTIMKSRMFQGSFR